MMDRRLFIAVLGIYILIGQGDGKTCLVSRARLNPTLYRNTTCPGECCSDLSFKFCCQAIDYVNKPVIIAFCVIVGVLIIAVFFIIFCCRENKNEKKVRQSEEKDDESYHAGQNGDPYIYQLRVGSEHHGYPSPRAYRPHHVKY